MSSDDWRRRISHLSVDPQHSDDERTYLPILPGELCKLTFQHLLSGSGAKRVISQISVHPRPKETVNEPLKLRHTPLILPLRPLQDQFQTLIFFLKLLNCFCWRTQGELSL
jgi:hypothetical protein